MKKKIWIVLLSLIFTFAGCGSKVNLHVYEYPYDGVSILNYTGDSYDYPKADFYTDDSAEPSAFFDFKGTRYELSYYETSRKEFIPYEEENYRNQDGVEISFKKGTEQICEIQSENGLRITDLENPDTEEEFRQISDTFVKDYIDVPNYTCSLTTEVAYFLREGEKASRWYEKKDSFYTSSSEIESVQYIFTYIRYFKGWKTDDMAEVVLNPDGTLDRLILVNIGAFEGAEKRLVQQDILESAISGKIAAICPEGYQVGNIQNDAMVCMGEAGKLFYVVAVKPTIQVVSSDEHWEENCIFIVVEE